MIHVWTSLKQKTLVDSTVGRILQKEGVPFKYVGLHDKPFAMEGDVILALGTQALAQLQEWGVVPKARKTGWCTGRVFKGNHASAVVSYDCSYTKKEPKYAPDVRWSTRLAARLHQTGSALPQYGKYEWTDSLTELTVYVEKKFAETGAPVPVAMDLETEGLFPWYPGRKIITSQWTAWPGRASVLNHFTVEGKLTYQQRLQILFLLTSPKVRLWGSNLKFDLEWIWRKWGIRCENFTFEMLIAASLLDENRSNSLNALTKELIPGLGGYDDEFNEKYDKGKMAQWVEEIPDELVLYAGGDADATLQVSNILRRRLAADPQLARFFQIISMPAVRAFEKIEDRGVLVDLSRYRDLEIEVKAEIKKLTTEAFACIPVAIKAKYADNLSLTRDALVRDFLFSHSAGCRLRPTEFTAKPDVDGNPRPSTAMDDHLSQFAATESAGAFITALGKINKMSKLQSGYIGKKGATGEYVKGFLSDLRPDGRFHPTYMLYAGAMFEGKGGLEGGTNTGRLSAKGPAIQTLMKHGPWAKKLRKCYTAPDGMVCWQLDFSQGELRIAACLANELAMIAAYKKGVDIHAKTGASMAGIQLDEFMSWKPEGHPKHDLYAEFRQKAKAVNFGFLYSMGAKGFVKYAWKSYGAVFTLPQAEETRETFFSTYPGLLPWHDRMRALAHKQGFVRSPLGRIRHLPHIWSGDKQTIGKAERQAINSPVQSSLSDLALWVAAEIDRQMVDVEERFYVTGQTHDSLNGYAMADTVEEDLARACQIAHDLPIQQTFGWNHQIPFPVDAEYGPSMGELSEFSLAA